jgi:hypothetical protein
MDKEEISKDLVRSVLRQPGYSDLIYIAGSSGQFYRRVSPDEVRDMMRGFLIARHGESSLNGSLWILRRAMTLIKRVTVLKSNRMIPSSIYMKNRRGLNKL